MHLHILIPLLFLLGCLPSPLPLDAATSDGFRSASSACEVKHRYVKATSTEIKTRFGSYTPAALTPTTRYWLVCHDEGGVAVLSHSAIFSELHFSTFMSDENAKIVSYSQSDDHYTYLDYTTQNRILNSGSATVSTQVSLGPYAPEQASEVILRATWSSTTQTVVTVRTATPTNTMTAETTTTGFSSTGHFPVSTANGHSVYYLVGNAAAALTLHIAGFTM